MFNLTAASQALRDLHKALIAHQAQAVAFNGSSLQLYKLVTEDANFAWLKPMTDIVTTLDEVSGEDVDGSFSYARKITGLMSNPDVKTRLNSALQNSPDAVLALGALRAALP